LAAISYFLSWVSVQALQVFDNIAATLGGSETEVAITIPGIGVSVVNLAVVLVIIAAVAQFFRPSPAKELALQQG
jgi:hypothetical protein